MHQQTLVTLLALFVYLQPTAAATTIENKQPLPIGWIYAKAGTLDMTAKPGVGKNKPAHLARGTLAPVFKIIEKDGVKWAQIRILNLATALPQVGWVESGQADVLPADSYPSDATLLGQLGEPYVTTSPSRVRRLPGFWFDRPKGHPCCFAMFLLARCLRPSSWSSP